MPVAAWLRFFAFYMQATGLPLLIFHQVLSRHTYLKQAYFKCPTDVDVVRYFIPHDLLRVSLKTHMSHAFGCMAQILCILHASHRLAFIVLSLGIEPSYILEASMLQVSCYC